MTAVGDIRRIFTGAAQYLGYLAGWADGYRAGYAAAHDDANTAWRAADRSATLLSAAFRESPTAAEREFNRLGAIREAHDAGLHGPHGAQGCRWCSPLERPDLFAARLNGEWQFTDGPSEVHHNRNYGVAAESPLFGSDAHGGPMSGEGPINVIDGCDWPRRRCVGHTMEDPCANGCSDPAAHAEGGHDL